MVHDDAFFLRLWIEYYGDLLGKSALYVVNHGGGEMVRDLAAGTNLIEIPNDFHPKFDAKRWRLLNHLVQGLRIYYDKVIVGDVDELVVADPALGGLVDMLERAPKTPVTTPLGLEVVHKPAEEPTPLERPVLARRSFVRIAPLYAKPCIVGGDVRLSRGGHYAGCPTLTMPEGLYLLHLKHCDRDLYQDTTTRRNAVAAATGAKRPKDAMIGRHWFSLNRDDARTFSEIDEAPLGDGFDMSKARASCADTWRPRKDTGFWEFDPEVDPHLYRLPDRFHSLF